MKKARGRPKKTTKQAESNSATFQVRFDPDLHERLKAAADEAGISMNQLIQGMCRGCCDFLVQGQVTVQTGIVRTEPRKGCLFFGRTGFYASPEQRELHEAHTGETLPANDNGHLWFSLDFTSRGAVHHAAWQ